MYYMCEFCFIVNVKKLFFDLLLFDFIWTETDVFCFKYVTFFSVTGDYWNRSIVGCHHCNNVHILSNQQNSIPSTATLPRLGDVCISFDLQHLEEQQRQEGLGHDDCLVTV